MNEQEEPIHRTWVHFLLDSGHKEASAIALESDLKIIKEDRSVYDEDGNDIGWRKAIITEIYVPGTFYTHVKNDKQIRETFEETLDLILLGRELKFWDPNGDAWSWELIRIESMEYNFYIKLLPVEVGWQDTIRALIASSKGVRNQGATTELLFAREKKDPILYDGLKFASQSEVRIAQELKLQKVLFFPLAVGVRAETGQQYKDHCEVDFLVCANGVWGILEVSGPSHNGRLAYDTEKDRWLKKSGILCIEHRTAEQCYANPKKVTDEFLVTLAQYKK